MKLTPLSDIKNQPSFLLESCNTTVLFDCVVDFEPLASFLPCSVVNGNRGAWMKKVRSYDVGAGRGTREKLTYSDSLKQIGDFVYVNRMPRIRPVSVDKLDVNSLDAVLISSVHSLISLPFLFAHPNFRAKVYATEPLVQLAKLLVDDLISMLDRVERDEGEEGCNNGASSSDVLLKLVYRSFLNAPNSDPENWQLFYSSGLAERCFAEVQTVYYRQKIIVNGELTFSAHPNGLSIGACNWLLEMGSFKMGYMNGGSLRPSHTKSMSLESFHNLDVLLLGSISRIDGEVRAEIEKFLQEMAGTLYRGGCVLCPVQPTGRIYDLLELTVRKLTSETSLAQDIPIYFVSSVAESSLAFANIYPEWLSDEKGSRVNLPEEPFVHSELVRGGRVKVYDCLHGAFSKEFRTPCVLYCGHPSLRFGEVVHFLDMWGGDKRNAIMCLDPEFPLEQFYGPYRSLAIRAYYFPIDTRLQWTQFSNQFYNNGISCRQLLISEKICPDEVAPEKLKLPAATSLKIIADTIKLDQSNPIASGAARVLAKKAFSSTRKRQIKVDPEVMDQFMVGIGSGLAVPGGIRGNASDFGISYFQGAVLSAYDNDLLLKKRKIGDVEPMEAIPSTKSDLALKIATPNSAGRLSLEQLERQLKKPNKEGLRITNVQRVSGKQVGLGGDLWTNGIRLPEIGGAAVVISRDGSRSRVVHSHDEKHRTFLCEAIRACLHTI